MTIVIVGLCNPDITWPFIVQSEKIGYKEVKALLECKKQQPKQAVLEFENAGEMVPLPNGAVLFKNKAYDLDNQYLSTYESFWHGYNDILKENGYEKEEQIGTVLLYVNNTKNIKLKITQYVYTKNFVRFDVQISKV